MDMDQVTTTDAVTYVRSLPDECVDIVFTDPPYPNGMEYFAADIEDAKFVLSLAFKKARKRVICFWSPMHAPPAQPKGWYLASKCIWSKRDAGTGIKYEDIYVWEKYVAGAQRKYYPWRVYEYPNLNYLSRRDFYDHPTQKPLDCACPLG